MRTSFSTFVYTSTEYKQKALAAGPPAIWAATTLALLYPTLALAGETSGQLPWNNFLDVLQENITGPTATAVIFIAIAGALVVWSMSDDHRGLVRFGKALGALAVLASLGALLGALGIGGATV